nr:hypothetical protein CFP56_03562 [Quercus suber]
MPSPNTTIFLFFLSSPKCAWVSPLPSPSVFFFSSTARRCCWGSLGFDESAPGFLRLLVGVAGFVGQNRRLGSSARNPGAWVRSSFFIRLGSFFFVRQQNLTDPPGLLRSSVFFVRLSRLPVPQTSTTTPFRDQIRSDLSFVGLGFVFFGIELVA